MTQHIAQEQAVDLATRKIRAESGPEYVHELCNAAIQHYLDQHKAELPVLQKGGSEMTTPNEELLARAKRLRYELDDSNARLDRQCVTAMYEMAQALQSQAEHIATLEGDVEYLQKDIDAMCNAIPNYHWSGGAAELIAECFAERDTLRAELADAELHTKQVERGLDKATAQLAEIEPVGYANAGYLESISEGYAYVYPSKMTGASVPLFTHPMPAESKDAERYRWLRDYLISPSTHFDDLIVSADKADTLDGVIDEALMAAAKAREPA